jgi:uncharacterized membrane protein YhaH (DUF805 family)
MTKPGHLSRLGRPLSRAKAKPGFVESLGSGPPPPEGDWYYISDDRPAGPAGPEEVLRLVKAGLIDGETFVWTEGIPDWAKAKTTALAAFLGAKAAEGAPPLPNGHGAPAPVQGEEAPIEAAPPRPNAPPLGPWPPAGPGQGHWQGYLGHAFANLFVIHGRASRAEYWLMALVWILLYSLYLGVVYLLFFSNITQYYIGYGNQIAILIYISILLLLLILVSNFGLKIRRLHDIGMSGWYYLLGLLPIIGYIITLVVALWPSTKANEFGPGPWRPGPY